MKSNPCNTLALLVLATGLGLACRRAPAQGAQTTYEAVLWIDGGFSLDESSIESLKERGITAIDAEGPGGVAKAGATGLPFYVDHAVPKGFLHQRSEAFEQARARWRADPTGKNLLRDPCLRDPKALERAFSDLKNTTTAAAPFSPMFLSFTDEPSATRGTNPVDWCRCEFCAAAFPRFLADRFGSKAVSEAQTDTEDARRALFHGIGPLATVARWNETRAFTDASFLDALAKLSAEARRLRPGIRLALLGAQMPSAFGGFDWEELAGRFDVIEPYDWGAARDLARSVSPRSDFYQTLVPRGSPDAATLHRLWRGFIGGDRGVILFDATQWAGAASRPAQKAPLDAIAPLLETFESARLLPWRRAAPLRPQIAILHGMASTRIHWLLDTRNDGASWVNRLTSYDVAESSEAVNREAWTSLLSDLGFSYRFVTLRQLREGALADEGLLALVLPRMLALADADVAAIQAFGASHLVVADCQLGLMNARLQLRDKPALDEMFGIARPQPKGVDDLVTQEAESRPGAPVVPAEPRVTAQGASAMQVVGTAPIFLVHGPRATRTLYLNARIGSYVKNRLQNPEVAERLRGILRPLFIASGVRPRFELTQLSPPPVWPFAVSARKDGDDILVGIELSATTGARPIDWNGPVATARVRVRVTFPGTYQASNLLTGEQLGSRNACDVEVSATQPVLLKLHP